MRTYESKVKQNLIKELRSIYDPEIDINIYDLGLIYDIQPTDASGCNVTMTLTSPFCPVADSLVDQVRTATKNHFEGEVNVEITFEPPWTMESLTEEARLILGYD